MFTKFIFKSLLLLHLCLSLVQLTTSVNRNPYSRDEIKAIEKFRPLVENYLTMDFQKTNSYLLRWLRGNNFNLNDAEKELKKFHEWRKENKIDSIFDEVIPKDLPYSVAGFDKGGRPIALHPFGRWNLRKYALAGKQQVAVRQYQRLYEEAIRKVFTIAEREGRDVDQIYVLTDMAGYSLREHSCLACVPVTLDFARGFASGVIPFAKNITLVNSPQIFQPVLGLARAIVVKVPVRDYDSNRAVWEKLIAEDISKDQLPTSLGGKLRF